MDEQEIKQGGGGTGPVLILAAMLLLVPLLYVFSIGPVVWLDSQVNFSEQTGVVLRAIYAPLIWAMESELPVIGPATTAYVDWCDG